MANLKLIPVNERREKKCRVCGTTASVKYYINLYDADGTETETDVPCCNMCALELGLRSAEAKKEAI